MLVRGALLFTEPISPRQSKNLFCHVRLQVVGPLTRQWNLLRDTDGERFVPIFEGRIFSRDY